MQVSELQLGVVSLLIEGRAYRCILDETAEGPSVLLHGQRFPYTVEDPRSLRSRRSHGASGDGPKPIRAPMPGRVVRVLADVGDEVTQHQGIVVIEAMKMQNELKSPKAGKIARIHVSPGDTVQSGDVLAIIE
ncbi:MAG: acyl-CoA carboxylase biotin carboxyl carrier protein subunit [Acidobacteriaceae bacterium]